MRARMIREVGGTWGVEYHGKAVVSAETYQVAANVTDALNGQGPPTDEAAEVAEAIHRSE